MMREVGAVDMKQGGPGIELTDTGHRAGIVHAQPYEKCPPWKKKTFFVPKYPTAVALFSSSCESAAERPSAPSHEGMLFCSRS